MQFTLPEPIIRKAERLAQDRGFATVSEYLSELVQEDESQAEPFAGGKAEVEAALLAGLDSGPATEMTSGDWGELKRRVRDFHGKQSAAS